MKISIASDHAGFLYKEAIIAMLKEEGHEVVDFGTFNQEQCDYPIAIIPAAESVASGECERGIVLGGSGNGEAIIANKVKGVRCALVWNKDTAILARQHNNANIISIGERMISLPLAKQLVALWLTTTFEGGRHERRIAQIANYESGKMMVSSF
ncbi:MAG: ribose-5-phosphate isomerase [Chthoniobacterales bacterium]